jgi:YVTN family beta-propeller protein
MKTLRLNYFLIASALTLIVASCHKDKVIPNPGTPVATRAGLYILNQGGLGNNNSTLTYYDYATKNLAADIFSSVNGAPLGDTGNDIEIYGSKMYITVNNSNRVDILNAKTGKLIKTDSLHQCRSIAFYKNNAFITTYDNSVAVMDTASLSITKTIAVGRNPEQLVVANDKLYVANSGGLNTDGVFDNTVSVVDLTSLTETKKITVIANPQSMAADAYGNIYVASIGDYANIPGGLTVIDSKTDVVKSHPAASVGYAVPITVSGDFVYYITADNKIAVYNAKTQTPVQPNFIADGTKVITPYAIGADAVSGEVFITDAKDYSSNGTLYAFDKTGKLEYSITTGINPGKIALVNK